MTTVVFGMYFKVQDEVSKLWGIRRMFQNGESSFVRWVPRFQNADEIVKKMNEERAEREKEKEQDQTQKEINALGWQYES